MDMVSFAAQVAAELGDGWAATNGHWANHQDAFLVNPDVVGRIHLALRDKRIHISGSLPNDWQEHAPASWMTDVPERKSISVAPDQAPGRVAGAITRRLLPAWKEYTDWTAKRKATSDKHKDDRAAAVERLVALLPGARHDSDGEIRFGNLPGVNHGTVAVHADGGLHIDRMSLTADGAEALFKALASLSK